MNQVCIDYSPLPTQFTCIVMKRTKDGCRVFLAGFSWASCYKIWFSLVPTWCLQHWLTGLFFNRLNKFVDYFVRYSLIVFVYIATCPSKKSK